MRTLPWPFLFVGWGGSPSPPPPPTPTHPLDIYKVLFKKHWHERIMTFKSKTYHRIVLYSMLEARYQIFLITLFYGRWIMQIYSDNVIKQEKFPMLALLHLFITLFHKNYSTCVRIHALFLLYYELFLGMRQTCWALYHLCDCYCDCYCSRLPSVHHRWLWVANTNSEMEC